MAPGVAVLRHAREEFTLIFCRYLLAIALAMAVSGRASAAQPEQLPERTLLPGEVIRIEIEGEEELSRTVTIGSDGKVSLGFPGEVELAGLTRMEAAAAIRETLLRYLRDPVVAVTLVEHRFSVLGAVRRPGQFPMSGDQIPILDALAQAGGPEDRANLRRVRLVRQTREGPHKVLLDLQSAIREPASSALPLMQPGDVLYVDRRKPALGTTLLTVAGVIASMAWAFR